MLTKSVIEEGLGPLLLTSALLLFTLLALYLPCMAGQRSWFMSDHCFYFQPFTSYIAERLRQGQLPLWNPYLYCGMAQVAVPSPGILYPFNWLFALGTYSQALGWIMLLHQGIAFIGAYLLVKSFKWGEPAACLGGLVYALSGYMCSLLQNFTLVEGAAWLPLILWSFRNIGLTTRESKSAAWLSTVAASLSMAGMIAAGRPEVSIPGFLFVLCALLAMAVVDGRAQRGWAALSLQSTALLSALLLSAPVILPVAEWVSLSPRAHGLNLTQVLMWSANWYDLLGVAFLQPFRDLQVLGAQYLYLVTTRSLYLPYIPSCYIGPLALTLCIWGFFDPGWRFRWPTVGCLTISLIMCLGENLIVAPFLVTHVPGLSVFRYPIKWMIFPLLCLALAGARGMKLCQEGTVSKAGQRAAFLIWILALVLGIVILLMGYAQKDMILTAPLIKGNRTLLPAGAETLLGGSIILGAGLGILASSLYSAALAKVISHRLAAVVLLCAVALNLGVACIYFQQMTTVNDFFARPQKVAKQIKEWQKGKPEGRLLALYFDPMQVPGDYRLYPDAPWTPSFFQYSRQLLLPNTNVPAHVRETFGYEAAETGFFRKLFMDRILHQCSIGNRVRKLKEGESQPGVIEDVSLLRFCQSTGTRWIGTQAYKGGFDLPKLDSRFFDLSFEDRPLNVRLFIVKDAPSRAYFSPYWKWVDSQQQIFDAAVNAVKSGYDPILTPLVERHTRMDEDTKARANILAPPLPEAPDQPPENGEQTGLPTKVDILADQEEHISLSVNAPKPGFVFLADHYYPGWRAFVDGVPRPIYRANLEIRAVYIPSGGHLIEFSYQPASFRLGLYMASVAAAVLAAILGIALWPSAERAIRRMAGQTA